jgi:hypothetical protein
MCFRSAETIYRIPEAGKDSIILGPAFFRFGINYHQDKLYSENSTDTIIEKELASFSAYSDVVNMCNIMYDQNLGIYKS